MARINIADLSRITGFSKTTISHVLNNKDGARISPRTRELIRRAAREHNYVPNFFARNILQGRTRTLAMLVRSLEDPAALETLAGAERRCRERGYRLFAIEISGDATEASKLIQDLIERGVEGIFAEGLEAPQEALRQLRAFGIGLALGESPANGIEADAVFDDVDAGFRLLAESLAARGHRAAVILSGGGAAARRSGSTLAAALEDQGLQARCVRVKGSEALANPARLLGGEGSSRATAAVCLSGLLAVGLLTRALRQELRIPEDFSLVAVGSPGALAFESPRLARLEWPERERGSRAADLLIERAEEGDKGTREPRRAAMPPQFDEGETLGPAHGTP